MGRFGSARFMGLWRFAVDVLTGAAASALVLGAMGVMDVQFALLMAAVPVGVGLLIERSTLA